VHLALIILLHFALDLCFKPPALLLITDTLLLGVFHFLVSLIEKVLHSGLMLALLVVELARLTLDRVNLAVQDELLSDHVELHLLQILGLSLEVFSHLLVLRLEHLNMLVRCLVVVKEASNASLVLIINNFLLQDLKFEVHKVHLLLKVRDVLFLDVVFVGVVSKTVLAILILASELDGGRFVALAVKQASASLAHGWDRSGFHS
jgi:hypothetical protein